MNGIPDNKYTDLYDYEGRVFKQGLHDLIYVWCDDNMEWRTSGITMNELQTLGRLKTISSADARYFE